MSFGKLAAGALAAITLAGSLPAAAAPIFDRGAHYIFKFEAQQTAPNAGRIIGQITVNAGAYQDGFYGEQYASGYEHTRSPIIAQPIGLLSMNVTIDAPNSTRDIEFDLYSAKRVIDQINSRPPETESVSSVDLSVGGKAPSNGGLGTFAAYLNFYGDNIGIPDYYDLNFVMKGNSTSGTVSGEYSADGAESLGCNTGRCQFSTTYTVAVPEPASLALLSTGILGLMAARRRRKTV